MGNIFVNTLREGGRLSLLPQHMAARAEGAEPEGGEEPDTKVGGASTDDQKEEEPSQDTKADRKGVESSQKVGGAGVVDAEDGQKGEEPNRKVGVVEDVHLHCCLGGYENTLLGYRSRIYKSIAKADLRHRIDVIMFGHVMYEMLSGRELERVCPEESDYEMVQDEAVRDVLRRIFDLDAEPTVEEVSGMVGCLATPN